MNTKDLVHGAIQAQNMTGGDLLTTLNTPMFNHLPLDKKVEFINEYASSNGPLPEPMSKAQKIRHALENAAYMGSIGLSLGLAHHLHKTGKGLGDLWHEGLLPNASGEAKQLADKQFNDMWQHAALPTQVGGIVGAVSGYKGASKRDQDVRSIRQELENVRHGANPSSVLFGAEQLHAGKTGHFDQKDLSHHTNVLKSNLFPFGAM